MTAKRGGTAQESKNGSCGDGGGGERKGATRKFDRVTQEEIGTICCGGEDGRFVEPKCSTNIRLLRRFRAEIKRGEQLRPRSASRV